MKPPFLTPIHTQHYELSLHFTFTATIAFVELLQISKEREWTLHKVGSGVLNKSHVIPEDRLYLTELH